LWQLRIFLLKINSFGLQITDISAYDDPRTEKLQK